MNFEKYSTCARIHCSPLPSPYTTPTNLNNAPFPVGSWTSIRIVDDWRVKATAKFIVSKYNKTVHNNHNWVGTRSKFLRLFSMVAMFEQTREREYFWRMTRLTKDGESQFKF